MSQPTVNPAPSPQPTPGGGGTNFGGGGSRAQKMFVDWIPGQVRQTAVPKGLPRFLGDRGTIFYAWMIAMAIVGWDDWHNYKILPRPRRLWDTSLLYGLLALLSLADAVVPLANVFAVGYAMTLLWNYYNGAGQFGGPYDSTAKPGKGGTSTNPNAPATQAGLNNSAAGVTNPANVQKAAQQTLQNLGSTHGGVQ